jgi:hypothetical protein
MITYTHKGWIGLCPVYLANIGADAPNVAPRLPSTDWLLHLSLWLFDQVSTTSPAADHGMIPIRVTGKLAQPITDLEAK